MENKETNFALELMGRVINFLDPKKVAIVLIFAVLSGLVGFAFGEMFLQKEYRTTLTLSVKPLKEGNANQNLSNAHHIADVLEALYDNDEIIEATLKQFDTNRSVKEFVNKLNVEREEKTVLVKINYTDYSKESAKTAINAYTKNLCQAITLNLGYNNFEVLSPASEPALINHTKTAVIIAVLIELLIAVLIIVIRVFPGVIIITGADLNDFSEPILGEVFSAPMITDETEETEEEA